jgi:hypothetical protein
MCARRRRTWNNRGALQEQLGNLVAAELDVRRALELGGCPKAATNLSRISGLLSRAVLELSPLQPCWKALPPTPDQCALVTFTFGEGPIGLFLVDAAPDVHQHQQHIAHSEPQHSEPLSTAVTAGEPDGAAAGELDVAAAGELDGGEPAGAAARDSGAGGGRGHAYVCPWAAEGEVLIAEVYEGSQAYACSVPVGGVLESLNGTAFGRLSHTEASARMMRATRPLALRVRCPPGWRACGDGGACETDAALQDTLATNGGCVFADGFKACLTPLPPGGCSYGEPQPVESIQCNGEVT